MPLASSHLRALRGAGRLLGAARAADVVDRGIRHRTGIRPGPQPATPIVDETGLEVRRAVAGLDPYADYLAEMTEVCAELPE